MGHQQLLLIYLHHAHRQESFSLVTFWTKRRTGKETCLKAHTVKVGARFNSNAPPLASTLLSFLHKKKSFLSWNGSPKDPRVQNALFFLDEEMNVGARVAWWGHSLTQRPAHSWQTQFSSLSDRHFLSKTQPTFSTVTKHCRKTKHCQTSSSQLKIISEREAQRCALAEQARLCPLWGRGAVLTTQEELPFNTEKPVPGKSFTALKND